MARIRTVKPEFWTSEQVMECAIETRLLFIGLWNFADDAGRMALSAKRIKAQIFPSDDITSTNVRRMIDELEANGLIAVYVVDNVEYIQVTGWHHQKIDRPQKSKFPGPGDDGPPNGRRTIAVGREGKGEEGKGDRARPGKASASPAGARTREAATARAEPEPAAPIAAPPPAPKPAAASPTDAGPGRAGWNTRANFDRVEARLRADLPGGGPQDLQIGPMAALEADGYDLEAEIVPTMLDVVAAAAGRRNPIRTWGVIAARVRERVDQARQVRRTEGLSPTPPAASGEPMVEITPEQSVSVPVLEVYLRGYAKTRHWPEWLGPEPGQRGCKVPPEMLAEHGLKAAA